MRAGTAIEKAPLGALSLSSRPPNLYDSCFFKRGVGTFLVDGADSRGGEGKSYLLIELRDEDSLLLEIDTLPDIARRVELCCAGAVRVAACDERSLFGYRALFSHKFGHASMG